jgi:hypothetical protein
MIDSSSKEKVYSKKAGSTHFVRLPDAQELEQGGGDVA